MCVGSIVLSVLFMTVFNGRQSLCEISQQIQKSPNYGSYQLTSQPSSFPVQARMSSISWIRDTTIGHSWQEIKTSSEVNDNQHSILQEVNSVTDTVHSTAVSRFEGISYSGPCSIQYCSKDTIVNCIGRSLTEVRSTWFPENTTILLMDNNNVEVIDNVNFSHLNNLRVLSLSNNILKQIHQDSFNGLEHLETLILEYNRLTSYPPGLFDSLVSLTDLRLRYNKENSNLPSDLFTHLKNLNSLTIDANGNTFSLGNEFLNLTKLGLSGNVKILDRESFENFQYITQLDIEDVPSLSSFTDSALQSLHQLDNFTLVRSYIGITKSLHILKSLIGRNMTSIVYYRVSINWNEGYSSLSHSEGTLNLEKTQYLIQICVRDFSLKSSHIFVLEENAFVSPLWNKCLRHLDLSGNPILGSRFAIFFVLNLKNIENVNIESAFRSCYDKESFSNHENVTRGSDVSSELKLLPTTCDTDLLLKESRHNKYGNKDIHSNEEDLLPQKYKAKTSVIYEEVSSIESTNLTLEQKIPCPCSNNNLIKGKHLSKFFTFYFSKSLKHIQIRRLVSRSHLSLNVVLVGLDNLVSLDTRDNILQNFTGRITGLDSLQILKLSGNDLSNLAEYFFDGMCNLVELDLSNCQMNPNFFAQQSARITQNLNQLKRLDLSSNMLYSLKPGIFATNKMLEQLDLSKNRFKNIPFNLKDTPNLKMLDLRENSLLSIEPYERVELDKLANKPGGFDLLISGNILSCECYSFKFLQWLVYTHVRLDNAHNFTCINNKGDISYWSITNDLEEFWRNCWGETFLSLALILLFSMVIGFLSVFVIWKNKTFLWTKLLEIVIGYKQKRREDYQIGVFIGYADKDYNFPCHVLRKYIEDELHLTTYVPHRDMNLSRDVASSIVDAINASWRIILVWSDNFLDKDDWSTFTRKAAVYAQSPANPSRVVVLVHENLEHQLPAELVSALTEDNILVVSQWTMSYNLRKKLKTRL